MRRGIVRGPAMLSGRPRVNVASATRRPSPARTWAIAVRHGASRHRSVCSRALDVATVASRGFAQQTKRGCWRASGGEQHPERSCDRIVGQSTGAARPRPAARARAKPAEHRSGDPARDRARDGVARGRPPSSRARGAPRRRGARNHGARTAQARDRGAGCRAKGGEPLTREHAALCSPCVPRQGPSHRLRPEDRAVGPLAPGGAAACRSVCPIKATPPTERSQL